jgi:hypothetical protein
LFTFDDVFLTIDVGSCDKPSPPRAGVMGVLIEIVGVAPPDEARGVVAPTLVTGAVPLEAAVIRPLAFTVREALVKAPTFELTVARVATCDPPPGPAVTSPVSWLISPALVVMLIQLAEDVVPFER